MIYLILIFILIQTSDLHSMDFLKSFVTVTPADRLDEKRGDSSQQLVSVDSQPPARVVQDVDMDVTRGSSSTTFQQKRDEKGLHNYNISNNNNYLQVKIDFTNFINIKQYTRKLKDQAAGFFGPLTRTILNNKKWSCIYAAGTLYAIIQMKLIYLTTKLSSPNCWSKWQSNNKLEQLYQIPQSVFSHNLLKDIQRTYTTVNNPTDFVTPLVTFMHETDNEIKYLKQYQRIVNWISRLKVSYIFFYSGKLYDDVPDRLNRLSFMKNTFLSWLTDFKINHPQPQPIDNIFQKA